MAEQKYEMKVIDWHFVYTGGSLPSSINKDDLKTVEVARSQPWP